MIILRSLDHALLPSQSLHLTTQLPHSKPPLSLDSWYLYFVQTTTLSASEIHSLQDLLHATCIHSPHPTCDTVIPTENHLSTINSFVVVPRLGTISPWSTKTSDLLHHSGLSANIVRIERAVIYSITNASHILHQVPSLLHDRMTESIFHNTLPTEYQLFGHADPRPLIHIPLINSDDVPLSEFNTSLGLGLSTKELEYLSHTYKSQLQRNPTDIELFMFAQINSEHCRHKVFNATWEIDSVTKTHTLFQMIKNTYKLNPKHILSAYSDNAAVLEGHQVLRFANLNNTYTESNEHVHLVIKVETHNHPTAISPFPGAATGSGGEIRDEGAVGQGSRPKAGLCGFTVSNLFIPDYTHPWELQGLAEKPDHMASPLSIMIDGPLGSSRFNNEFGRPVLTGYFRTFCAKVDMVGNDQNTVVHSETRGFHKPIMLAGGMGSIRPMHVNKQAIQPGHLLLVLGGPSMLIGLGGGAASSVTSGSSTAALDFASVQRDNPEMQRRCQMVLDSCTSLGAANPIVSVHDVGAGGLCNAFPELVHDANLGATFEIRHVPVDDMGLSPLEIWCNESQERYVLAICETSLEMFERICGREQCPFAVVGRATKELQLVVTDSLFQTRPIDLPMDVLFGNSTQTHRVTMSRKLLPQPLVLPTHLDEAISRVLQLPAVASKSFLITIGDRSVGGLTTREQMVGPWQVPVADVAVTSTSFSTYKGEAMAIGERPPIAVIDPVASARVAVVEAVFNLLASRSTPDLAKVRLSANWMSAVNVDGEGANLYEAVMSVGMDLCPALGLTIPVGKDSLSMQAKWVAENGAQKSVTAPLALNVTAYATVNDVRDTLTPQLVCLGGSNAEPTVLVMLDVSHGQMRMGGSALAQVYSQVGNVSPNVDFVTHVQAVWNTIHKAREGGIDLLAYHDRSDGGLYVTIAEMVFAGRQGVTITVPAGIQDVMSWLFNEELAVVVQIRLSQVDKLCDLCVCEGLPRESFSVVAHVHPASPNILIQHANKEVHSISRAQAQRLWSLTSYHIAKRRDNPDCALSELNHVSNPTNNDPGLSSHTSFAYPYTELNTPFYAAPADTVAPKVAILREQGINGYNEMAYAFYTAGFVPVDIHMSEIMSGSKNLEPFVGMAVCGGFSYGDVLGAGRGWAKSILNNPVARAQFSQFFARTNTFTLGVCNGCQMISQLRELLPPGSGTDEWPTFERNISQQFEARTVMVEIVESRSILFKTMVGTRMPVPVAHGEGRAVYANGPGEVGVVAMRYIATDTNLPTEVYPSNPNGSVNGVTGVTSKDGRVTIMMPHPERATRVVANAYMDPLLLASKSMHGPWLEMFLCARRWVGAAVA